MIYQSGDEWRAATDKKVLMFGMSGLGKTHLATMLRAEGDWYHYSIDYRIGTRYMGEHIVDNFKREAMKMPFLADLLRTDSIYIASNITFHNLSPLSTYLGKPGNPDLGGLPFGEYLRRQEQHRVAEMSSLLDTGHFVERAQKIYRCERFVCDSGGSICEVVDPENPEDPVLRHLADTTLMVWIEGTEAHTSELVRRFAKEPKPMYYRPDFLEAAWDSYLQETGQSESQVDPDAFMRATFERAMAHRQPLYEAMARNWGVKVRAEDVARVRDPAGFEDLIAEALDTR